MKGSQGSAKDKNLEAGSMSPWRDNGYWFAPLGFFRFLSYILQDHLSRDGIAHSRLDPSLPTISQGSAPQASL